MVSVETILLLQQKVESAVQKIEQLKSENDALRAERSELTKALSEKTELLSRFSADEKKIEDGILGALTRLDSVENAILDSSGGFDKVEADCNTTREPQAPLGDATQSQAPAQTQAAPAAVQTQEAPAPQAAETQISAPVEPEPVTQAAAFAQAQEVPVQQEAAVQAEPTQIQEPVKESNPILGESQDGDDLFGDTSFETQEDIDADIF